MPDFVKNPEEKAGLKIVLLAYPDNPVGVTFVRTFLENDIPIQAVVLESKRTGSNWKRLRTKLRKDGLAATVRRIFQMTALSLKKERIADFCFRHEIPVCFVERMNSPHCEKILTELDPDLLVIVSAPILKDFIFKKARLGCLNPHPGWLPTYRGLGANANALKNGDKPGVTVHFVDSGIDTGRIVCREEIPVQRGDTVATINDRAMACGAELIARVIRDIAAERLTFPEIAEPKGLLYADMPYREVRKINRMLDKSIEKD